MQAVFAGHPEVKQAILYGSRVLGTYHEGSDIDVTLTGADVDSDVVSSIRQKLESLNFPYEFDLSIFRQIKNESLRNHVERVGAVFYEAPGAAKKNAKLPAGWKRTTIGEVCTVIAGQSPSSSHYNDRGAGLPFYQGKKHFGDYYIGEPTRWTERITTEAVAGDILMSVRAPVGPVNFATQRICIGRGLAAIRAGKQIDREFLFYLLLSKQNQIRGNEGAVFASINKTQIEKISFAMPNLSEQKRIVKCLENAFAEIATATANAEKSLANLSELKNSFLHKTFADGRD